MPEGQYVSNVMEENTDFILQLRYELLVAWQHVGAVLDQAAQGPQPQRRFAILFNNVKMRPVRSPTHLSCLLDNCTDALAEVVVQLR